LLICLGSWPLLEVAVVILSEIVLNFKRIRMKDIMSKIGTSVLITWALKSLIELIFNVGGQTIPLGRLY
jgi:hypothetical protein